MATAREGIKELIIKKFYFRIIKSIGMVYG